ncbi:hypothetical protein T4A_1539 [Trichinella pseudospiralis]|uniref:Uncharacterized protein n=1 Tax=Trichinella pseudospiralis TaxID=6337 RepID=A0A0V1DJU9_TRIPS|nr:hypothetical protein T4A_1539 [Trichinella pseudospiralis]
MAFYMDLNEKCNVHGDDFKNRETWSMAFYDGFKREM